MMGTTQAMPHFQGWQMRYLFLSLGRARMIFRPLLRRGRRPAAFKAAAPAPARPRFGSWCTGAGWARRLAAGAGRGRPPRPARRRGWRPDRRRSLPGAGAAAQKYLSASSRFMNSSLANSQFHHDSWCRSNRLPIIHFIPFTSSKEPSMNHPFLRTFLQTAAALAFTLTAPALADNLK